MNTADVEYLVHRLHEYFDVVNYYEVESGILLRISKYTVDGRISMNYDLSPNFDVMDTEAEIEAIRRLYDGEDEISEVA
jgi:hypothetical protein